MKTKAQSLRLAACEPMNRIAVAIMALILFMSLATSRAYSQDASLESLKESGKAFARVAEEVSPAVVFIQVEKTVSAPRGMMLPFRSSPYGGRQGDQPQGGYKSYGQGSGFIISKDGYVLTNNHVVGDADKVEVKLNDGRKFQAKTIGTDPKTDVAVVKIDAKDLPVLPLGDSDKLKVGEWVLAVGNPFWLSHTLTAGIVSAKGRTSMGITDYEDFIQTDAAINPGNSGGPLIDLNGEVIGINTAIASRTGSYAGIGFAIPISMARQVADQLIKNGTVTRGYLGIMIQNLTPELAEAMEIEGGSGIVVSEVQEGAPAEKAGVEQGDVIVGLDGETVDNIGLFRNHVSLLAPGTEVKLAIIRHGEKKNIGVKIGTLTDEQTASASPVESRSELGITVTPLTEELAAQLGYEGQSGVVITKVDPDSQAASAGLTPGQLIKEVDKTKIKTVEDFNAAMKKVREDGSVLLLLESEGHPHYVAFKLG